jgi:hypothetical protein
VSKKYNNAQNKKSNNRINPHGGIYFVNNTLSVRKINNLIYRILGKRAVNAKYSYSDCLKTSFYSHLCGGSCLEDFNSLRDNLVHPVNA